MKGFILVFLSGRDDTIRTCDPLLPKQVRYQLRHIPFVFRKINYVIYCITNKKRRQYNFLSQSSGVHYLS